MQHHVGPQGLDPLTQRSSCTARCGGRPSIVVEHFEERRQRRPDLGEFVGDFRRTASGAFIDLTLGSRIGAEPVEATGDDIGELTHHVPGHVACGPPVAPTRLSPTRLVDRSDQCFETTDFWFELGLGHSTRQAHALRMSQPVSSSLGCRFTAMCATSLTALVVRPAPRRPSTANR